MYRLAASPATLLSPLATRTASPATLLFPSRANPATNAHVSAASKLLCSVLAPAASHAISDSLHAVRSSPKLPQSSSIASSLCSHLALFAHTFTLRTHPAAHGGSCAQMVETVGQKRERPDEAMAPVPEEMALPSAVITRIVKSKLPEGVMIGKDTKAAFGKACSIFILYLSTIANDLAKEAKRTTVTAQDVINALKELEFDEFVPTIEACVACAAFREAEKARTIEAAAKKAVRVGEVAAVVADEGEVEEGADDPEEEEADE
ncbi:hypothetical protein AB1Y20_019715 [Prymnesium parvum]|uniref:Transcription factor CBF/NF-Y/archaeal histone domain-containing protein n=1 Tax=Prymnesium parvum TaxID=97485 RepID=A0AB34JSN0_PRYPA